MQRLHLKFQILFITTATIIGLFCLENPIFAQNHLFGVIEIGASGIKPFTVKKVPKADGTFGLEVDKKLDSTIINTLADGTETLISTEVGRYIQKMKKEEKIILQNIFVVGSSGVANVSNKDSISAKIRKLTGKKIEFVSSREEAVYSFKEIVPDKIKEDILVVDIGSGNILGCYFVSSKKQENEYLTFEIPWGTKKYSMEINRQLTYLSDIRKTRINLRKKLILPLIKAYKKNHPQVLTPKKVFLIGGISWAMSTFLHPDKQSGLVALKKSEIGKFNHMAIQSPNLLYNPELDYIKDEKVRIKAQKNINRIIFSVFSEQQIIAGSEVLKSIADVLDFSDKEVYFVYDSLNKWPMGYVKNKIKQRLLSNK